MEKEEQLILMKENLYMLLEMEKGNYYELLKVREKYIIKMEDFLKENLKMDFQIEKVKKIWALI